MLIKNFYKVLSLEKEEGVVNASIKMNKDHAIFKGHFPNNPVAPGVCIMQIIKELTEQVVHKKLLMEKASNIKFVALINPEVNPVLDLQLKIKAEEETVNVKNVTKFDETIALKLSATYKIV